MNNHFTAKMTVNEFGTSSFLPKKRQEIGNIAQITVINLDTMSQISNDIQKIENELFTAKRPGRKFRLRPILLKMTVKKV